MTAIRRTIQRGRNSWIEEVRRPGTETGYFVGCTRGVYTRDFEDLPEAEAYWRAAEAGTAKQPH
jgi:hypothetical protein